MQLARLRHRVVAGYRAFESLHDQLFVAPWRAGIAREARDHQDLLVTLVHLEALGIEPPAPLVSLELHPELVDSYHDWHRRAGMEQAPMPGVCC
ncbi:hypothetical protein BH23ACT9_BH23ACT9_33060 [soil metagenome]